MHASKTPEQLCFQCRQPRLSRQEELGHPAEAVLEVGGRRRAHQQWCRRSFAERHPFGMEPATAITTQLVGHPHFARGQLRHCRGAEVGQRTTAGCRGGEAPGGSLVVHQATRSVDGVDDHGPLGLAPDLDRFVEAFADDPDVAANAARTSPGAHRQPPGRCRRSRRPLSTRSRRPCPRRGRWRSSSAGARRARRGGRVDSSGESGTELCCLGIRI